MRKPRNLNFFSGILKNLFAQCDFHQLKEARTRIKPCDSVDNAFLRLFNQLQYCRFFIIFPMIVFIIHYLLLQLINSKVISNVISGWWLLIGFLFFPSIVSRFFTLCILSFWFLYGCKKRY